MPHWPLTLPSQPLLGGWSAAEQNNKAVVQPEIGPPIVRRRGTAAGSERSVTFVFTTAQLDDFETFYRSELRDGSLAFECRDPRTRHNAAFRFVGAYEYTEAGFGVFRLTARLLRLP